MMLLGINDVKKANELLPFSYRKLQQDTTAFGLNGHFQKCL